jgi:hypothetical protein
MSAPRLLLAALGLAASTALAGGPSIEHRTSAAHPLQYDLSRPRGWKPGGRYPVVVVVPDARREFKANLQAFVAARGDGPWLLVAPYVLTSGGASFPREHFPYDARAWARADAGTPFAFDEAGVAAMLAEVRERDGGLPGAFLTGWEAGGHTVWALAFNHPGWWRAVAPVSSNYQGRWLAAAPPAGEPRPPLKLFFCDHLSGDEERGRQFWLTQSNQAVEEAVARGFVRPALEVPPGSAHGPLAEAVLAWFAKVLPPAP